MSTANSTILWSFSRSVAAHLIQITSSWVTTSIVDTTLWRPSHFSSASKYALRNASRFYAVTMKVVKSHKSMASTTNVSGSTAMLTSGNTWRTSLTTCLWQLSSKIKFSAFTVAWAPAWILWTWSEILTVLWRYLTKVQCATCCGQILTTVQAGESLHAEPATPLDKTFQTNLSRRMGWKRLLAPINSSWQAIIGAMKSKLWRYSQRQTIVIGAATRLE